MEFEQIGIFGKNKKVAGSKTKKESSKDNLLEDYKQLYSLYYQLYDSLNIKLFTNEEIVIIDNIIAYPFEHVAEIDGTQSLSLKERIKLHKEYLNARN